jgi:hypothetical protein
MENLTTKNENESTLRVYVESWKEEHEQTMFIFDSDNFKELNLCETYDRNGQQIGCENAGCRAVDNYILASSIINKINEDDYDSEKDYKAAKLIAFLKEYDEEIHSTVKGFDYHDGHNWQTLLLAKTESFVGENEGLQEIDESLQTKILFQYLNEKELVEEGFGTKTYKSTDYEFVESYCVGDPYVATIRK